VVACFAASAYIDFNCCVTRPAVETRAMLPAHENWLDAWNISLWGPRRKIIYQSTPHRFHSARRTDVSNFTEIQFDYFIICRSQVYEMATLVVGIHLNSNLPLGIDRTT
jgi:hypothetical protein